MRYKITLKNETHLVTKDLKRFIKRCLEEFNKYYFVKHAYRNKLNISVVYKKLDNYIGGYAYYNSRTIQIKIPKDFKQIDSTLSGRQYSYIFEFAQTMFHELEHCEGKYHKEMRNFWKMSYPTPWANDYIINYKEPKPKQIKTPDMKLSKKLLSLENRKKNWESKLRRAQNALKIINRQTNYYTNRMAALSKDSKTELFTLGEEHYIE